jgi:hypothetical protein
LKIQNNTTKQQGTSFHDKTNFNNIIYLWPTWLLGHLIFKIGFLALCFFQNNYFTNFKTIIGLFGNILKPSIYEITIFGKYF